MRELGESEALRPSPGRTGGASLLSALSFPGDRRHVIRPYPFTDADSAAAADGLVANAGAPPAGG